MSEMMGLQLFLIFIRKILGVEGKWEVGIWLRDEREEAEVYCWGRCAWGGEEGMGLSLGRDKKYHG